MKTLKIILLSIFISFTSLTIKAEAESDALALRKSYPIQLFMGNCVVRRGQTNAIESQALKMGFKSATKEQASNYLQGNNGRSWFISNEHGKFGIASLENGLCSIFIHQGNPKELQASMESWLPPESSGFSYEKELVSESDNLSTTVYKLYRGNSFMEQWVITVTKQANSNLTAIMSHNTK